MKYFLYVMLVLSIHLPFRATAADASAPQSHGDSRADERFRSMDTDNKGFITFEEFQRRYPNMQRPAFDAINTGKDGRITLEEWRTFFQSHGAGGRMPPPNHGGGQGSRPLILPPAQ